ncbi:MAG: KH domain-containing protein [Sedimentisphaerales bacterium]
METTIQLGPAQKQLELFGPGDSYLRILRQSLNVRITARQDKVTITGSQKDVNKAADVLRIYQLSLYRKVQILRKNPPKLFQSIHTGKQ